MTRIPTTGYERVTVDGVRAARVECPGCGLRALLDHDVAHDGRVTPSLDCPRCAFHDFVILDEWHP